MPDANAQQAQRLIDFATQRLGRVEGNGQCWTLVDNGFQHVGFIKPASTYEWGRVVSNLSDARPGDVFQFTRFEVTTRVTQPDGSWQEQTLSRGEPRHTAILESVNGNVATFLESNVTDDQTVKRNDMGVRTATTTDDAGVRTSITVSGSFIIYRPQVAANP
ncbi:hypothetical protein [Roseibium sp. Sym1]|uniref:hypothetical protein n=1 Tax=Roseibium sp. Sym1 TaxID=3016006 RepID=UPI0022B51903|nr:hypothetical protein [Roseibium sp. Sym1]